MAKRKKPIPNDPMPEMKPIVNRPSRKISDAVVAMSRTLAAPVKRNNPFELPSFPSISLPKGGKRRQPMAMDEQIIEINAWAVQNTYNGVFANGATFLGYPYLAELAQIPEYRKIVETIAMHMTRKFIKMKATGADDSAGDSKADKIKQLTDDIENFKVRDVFRKAVEVDGYFGRAHLYIDLGYKPPNELKMPIGNGRDALSRIKVPKGSLEGFKIIEPVWTYPSNYNSNNPLIGDWYNPQSWFVLGKEMHHSRLLRMVGREVPDLLKPSYAFGGLALSQMAKPYVDNWLRTRQSVADVVWAFSTSGVMTDLQTLIQGQGEDLFARAELYNNLRNNRGLMLLNKDSEEFFQINTPLGTLDKLQAQAQEHMASVSSIPLVFLLGITPSGLNASSEGEIRAFYDFIHAFQKKFFTEPLTRVLDFIQLNRYGFIDPEITFEFEPLWSSTEKEQAEIDKTKAETDDLRINGGVISPLESRKAVANAPDTPYPGLDVTVLPVPPGEGGGDENGDGEEDPEGAPPIGGQGLDPGRPKSEDNEHPRIGGGSDDDNSPFAKDDANWQEGKHPRASNGQFGSGGGGSASGASGESVKSLNKVLSKPAGISGKYRQGLQDMLKDPGLNDEMKLKVKHKIVESYTAKKAQLLNAPGSDPDMISSIQKKINKLNASLGVKPAPVSVPINEPPKTEGSTKFANGYEVDKSHAQPDKFILKNKDGHVLGNGGEFGQNIPTKKFDTQEEAIEAGKAYEANKAKPAEVKAPVNTSTPAPHHNYVGHAEKALAKAGLTGKLTPTEGAAIIAYSSSEYMDLNQQMREGAMSKSHWQFAKDLNKALDKLPKHAGVTSRGAQLNSSQLALYKPGMVIEERAFTSTSKNSGFDGNVKYEIHGHSGRDISKLSSHKSEAEVLFKSGARFEVKSINGKTIVLHEVDYE